MNLATLLADQRAHTFRAAAALSAIAGQSDPSAITQAAIRARAALDDLSTSLTDLIVAAAEADSAAYDALEENGQFGVGA